MARSPYPPGNSPGTHWIWGIGEAESRSECRGENQRILHLRNRTFRFIAITVMRSSLFWDVAQRISVVRCRHFGTTYRFHFQVSSRPWHLKMGYPETSATTYQYTFRDIPEEQDLMCTPAEAWNDCCNISNTSCEYEILQTLGFPADTVSHISSTALSTKIYGTN